MPPARVLRSAKVCSSPTRARTDSLFEGVGVLVGDPPVGQQGEIAAPDVGLAECPQQERADTGPEASASTSTRSPRPKKLRCTQPTDPPGPSSVRKRTPAVIERCRRSARTTWTGSRWSSSAGPSSFRTMLLKRPVSRRALRPSSRRALVISSPSCHGSRRRTNSASMLSRPWISIAPKRALDPGTTRKRQCHHPPVVIDHRPSLAGLGERVALGSQRIHPARPPPQECARCRQVGRAPGRRPPGQAAPRPHPRARPRSSRRPAGRAVRDRR